MSDNTENQKIQCFCKWEKDDTDYKGFFKTRFDGNQVIGFVRKCHKCGLLRLSLKVSDPKYETKSTSFVPQQQAPQQSQQSLL